jgi:hypothetical protein
VQHVGGHPRQPELEAVVQRRRVHAPALLSLHRGPRDPRAPSLLLQLIAQRLGAILIGERAELDDRTERLAQRVGCDGERLVARCLLGGADPRARIIRSPQAAVTAAISIHPANRLTYPLGGA